ncbi:MAG: tol-pal system-associated acyl-CoA thioesterase [Azospirillaceae bacterium]
MTGDPSAPHHVRVYWEDTDGTGIVYHANYLAYAERARTEMLRALGFEQGRLLEDTGAAFVVRRLEIDYRSPARLDDLLVIATTVAETGRASLRLRQKIAREGREIAILHVHLACVDRRGRPIRVPSAIREAFAAVTPEPRADDPEPGRTAAMTREAP